MKTLKKAIKYIDYFGQPVQLNVKGKTTFKSVPSGILSLIVNLLMLIYSYQKVIYIFTYDN